MKKINLKSSELIAPKKKSKKGNTSVMIGVLLLLISFGAYGGVFYLISSTEASIDFTKDEIEKTTKKMDSEEAQAMYDFQGRLFEIEELLGQKISQNDILNKIGVLTLPGTRFRSLDTGVEGGKTKIEAVIVTIDHYALSQQLEAYSVMEESENVMLENSKQDEEGVEATLNFDIRK